MGFGAPKLMAAGVALLLSVLNIAVLWRILFVEKKVPSLYGNVWGNAR